ncbi:MULTISPECIES: MFS transporter [Aureimonas]|uniref:MFS family permease n=1 Tax=Aureimonas phyllosphaerae TaxID=1166078 RepID=A0A7W6FU49_9HYPH|nr:MULTISPECIES: MFS transporter [Aureimonas]MBB3934637.1 MFS family permease [Aureimonas phyllosphaerae]MBB3958147.1 MFS family permease [Aureimonas phyllosphaerae]SFE92581.1 Predicted arabinose efflux permease, MFS family [Aureimonas phyllosphaerae]
MRPRWQVISALGVFEILAWGSSVYLPAVLALPISRDTGWPLPWVVGGVSVGLLVSAAASPRVGATISARGGRPVLALGAVLLALGLAVLGLSPNLPVFLAGWVVVGLGMGMGLYDPAFATLGRLYGADARSAITTLTLWGGFASTVCWPLSAFMVEHVGWRGACLAYAALHVCVTLPLALLFVPSGAGLALPSARRDEPLSQSAGERRDFLLLVGVLVLCSTIFGLVSVHLLTLLQARGETLAAAVAFGAMVGPSQVGARVIEMAGRGRHHPLWTLRAAVALTAVGVCALAFDILPVAAAMVFYGAGNGILSIARGTVPLALFGPDGYASVMGRLARPAQVAQALAPTVGAVLLARMGPHATLVTLAVLSMAALGVVPLLRERGIDPHSGRHI